MLALLYFIDPKSLFQAFLNSNTAIGRYKGIAHFMNNPTELYHTIYWSSSIRTTSGEYTHFISELRIIVRPFSYRISSIFTIAGTTIFAMSEM